MQELSRSSGTQTGDEFQCQPVKFFFPAEYRRLHEARLVVHDDNSQRPECASGDGRRFLAKARRAQRKALKGEGLGLEASTASELDDGQGGNHLEVPEIPG